LTRRAAFLFGKPDAFIGDGSTRLVRGGSEMTNRSITAFALVLAMVLLAGCAGHYAANGASASIPSDRSLFSGAWRGSAYEIGGSSSGGSSAFYGPDLSLRINDDGTWTMTERSRGGAAVEYSGTSTARGNRVTLYAAGRPEISLTQSGRTLYGLVNMNSRSIVIEFTRAE
jgi:hypothetical protein